MNIGEWAFDYSFKESKKLREVTRLFNAESMMRKTAFTECIIPINWTENKDKLEMHIDAIYYLFSEASFLHFTYMHWRTKAPIVNF